MCEEDAKWEHQRDKWNHGNPSIHGYHITMDTQIRIDVYHTFAETMTTHKHAPQNKQVKSSRLLPWSAGRLISTTWLIT